MNCFEPPPSLCLVVHHITHEPVETTVVEETTDAPTIATPKKPVMERCEISDLAYFKKIALLLDQKVSFWHGRTRRILKLAQVMNQLSGDVIDALQLEAAVYLHDIGMSFLPDNLTLHPGRLGDEAFNLLKMHPDLGYEIAHRLNGWEEAALMVRQHHERIDGKGYPDQLTGASIHAGAQVLAIADTFEAMTQERAQRNHKRPFMRAILEINNCAGNQFSQDWVEIFNQVARQLQKKT